MVFQSLFGQMVEATSGNVFLELFVPTLCLEFGEPLAQHGELGGRQFSDSVFDLLNRRHIVHSTVHVSPEFNRAVRSPGPRFARASAIWASTI